MRTDPPSVKEVQKAIAKLKHGNAICVDKMHREILKVKDYWPPAILTSIAWKRRHFLENSPDSLTTSITKGDVKMYRNNISDETFHCR